MKVLLLNGSPHEKGCTYRALTEVAGALTNEGIETEIVHIGNQAIHGCIGCGKCAAARRFFGCVLAMLVKRWGTGLRAELLGREKKKRKRPLLLPYLLYNGKALYMVKK